MNLRLERERAEAVLKGTVGLHVGGNSRAGLVPVDGELVGLKGQELGGGEAGEEREGEGREGAKGGEVGDAIRLVVELVAEMLDLAMVQTKRKYERKRGRGERR